jgi:hypothetical protein
MGDRWRVLGDRSWEKQREDQGPPVRMGLIQLVEIQPGACRWLRIRFFTAFRMTGNRREFVEGRGLK